MLSWFQHPLASKTNILGGTYNLSLCPRLQGSSSPPPREPSLSICYLTQWPYPPPWPPHLPPSFHLPNAFHFSCHSCIFLICLVLPSVPHILNVNFTRTGLFWFTAPSPEQRPAADSQQALHNYQDSSSSCSPYSHGAQKTPKGKVKGIRKFVCVRLHNDMVENTPF